ncbi:hypothetical protein D3C81_1718800 [compost metagenome]
MQGKALLPQGIVFIQHIQLGPATLQAVEHLDASRAALFQHQAQVVVQQCVAIQVQRAVGATLLAQVGQQGFVLGQGGQADMPGQQLQHMGVLGHL